MAAHDGNGWVECRCGSRHWGRHGAAGLLLLRDPADGADGADGRPAHPSGTATISRTSTGTGTGGQREVLMQLRAAWTHQGGSWGVPGGARDSHEDPVTAALREAAEEAGVAPDAVTVVGQLRGVDHGDWRYTYVVALAARTLAVSTRTSESDELRWVALDAVRLLPLHPALDDAWPRLQAALIRGRSARRGRPPADRLLPG